MNSEIIAELSRRLLNQFPDLHQLKGELFLVKYGGAAMESSETRAEVCKEIAALSLIGIKLVVVHGGGKEISRLLARLGIESNFIGGLRQTTPEALVATEMALSGSVNKDLASRISHLGVRAVGISGRDARLFEARKIQGPNGEDLGSTGEVVTCDTSIIETLLYSGTIPVISPIAETIDGEALNINADYAAAALAGAIKAVGCVFLTDVDGVKSGGEVKDTLTRDEIDTMIRDGIISGGMTPKVQCALKALEAGCRSATICNASKVNVVALAITGMAGAGTRVVGGR
jgi:acetylglutamate kinase